MYLIVFFNPPPPPISTYSVSAESSPHPDTLILCQRRPAQDNIRIDFEETGGSNWLHLYWVEVRPVLITVMNLPAIHGGEILDWWGDY
jgi:hypothetical protein